jgi:hypothetical protein
VFDEHQPVVVGCLEEISAPEHIKGYDVILNIFLIEGGRPMMIDQYNPVIEFTAADRCDRCGAQAIVLARHEETGVELLFCGHHIIEHNAKLRETGWWFVADGVQAERAGYTQKLETILV